MRLVYLGAEVPSNRKLLLESGVRAVGFSYLRAKQRGFPKTKAFSFGDYFPEDCQIVVHPGLTEVTKYGASELESLAADYQDFVVTHIDRIDAFLEFDVPLGTNWRDRQRTFFQDAGPKFWPVWSSDQGIPSLQNLASRFPEVALSGNSIESETTLAAHTRNMVGVYNTLFHGMAVSRPDNIRQVPLATASTLSWASPMMRGETIVWDGSQLKRYQAKDKDRARSRYKAQVEKAGLDYQLILDDDAKEVTRLAIWSYQQLEDDMSKKNPGRPPLRVVDDPGSELLTGMVGAEEIVEMLSGAVDHKALEVDKPGGRLPAPREASERRNLPVLGVETRTTVEPDEAGRPVVREVSILRSQATSLRQCNSCFVASNCPAFKPESECAFSLPVEVKTKDQLLGLLQAMIEMQSARVAFARYAEELNGGYPDPNTSQEMDRLFKLVSQLKDIQDNKEYVRMTLERQGGAGVLSAIFGDRAQALRELDNGGLNEQATTRIIQGALED